jgi:hypothetical protein
MLGHLGINVVELRAAKTHYDALLPLLGFTEFVSADDEFDYRRAGGKPGTYPFFYPSTGPGCSTRRSWSRAAVLRDVLARPMGQQARGGLPLRQGLTTTDCVESTRVLFAIHGGFGHMPMIPFPSLGPATRL